MSRDILRLGDKGYVPRTAAGRANSSAEPPRSLDGFIRQERAKSPTFSVHDEELPEATRDRHAEKLAEKQRDHFAKDEHGQPSFVQRTKRGRGNNQGGGFDPRKAKKYGKHYLKSLY